MRRTIIGVHTGGTGSAYIEFAGSTLFSTETDIAIPLGTDVYVDPSPDTAVDDAYTALKNMLEDFSAALSTRLAKPVQLSYQVHGVVGQPHNLASLTLDIEPSAISDLEQVGFWIPGFSPVGSVYTEPNNGVVVPPAGYARELIGAAIGVAIGVISTRSVVAVNTTN